MANQRQTGSVSPDRLEDCSDETLMIRIGQGDNRAFTLLVGRHLPRVVGTAWRMTGNRADGEEVAQEAFARVWVNAAKWLSAEEGGTGKFSTWLYRVVMNLCIDRRRRPRTEALDTVLESGPEMADEAEGAAEGMARRQLAAEVAKAVVALPERQRMAIVLCVYEEVSNVEAARIMSLSVGAVESLLVRARKGLKEKLAHLQGDGF